MAKRAGQVNYKDLKTLIGKSVRVVIDRPLGSMHPKHGFLYEANYGYVEGITAPDGEEADAYVLGVKEPLKEFRGMCIALIHRTDDDDDKLVVVPEGMKLSDEEIRKQTHFQERFFKSVILR